MKLRFSSNNLRLRLRKSDIETLRHSGCVCDALVFCEGNQLEYALNIDNVPFINAEYHSSKITVHVPEALAKHWMDSEQVSLQHDQPLYNGFYLNILIEKDFPCRHAAMEETEDTFYELVKDE